MGSKGVFQLKKLRFFRLHSLGSVYLNNVEPGLEVRGVPGQVEHGGGAQLLLLAPVHKGRGGAVDGAFAQLYAGEAERRQKGKLQYE